MGIWCPLLPPPPHPQTKLKGLPEARPHSPSRFCFCTSGFMCTWAWTPSWGVRETLCLGHYSYGARPGKFPAPTITAGGGNQAGWWPGLCRGCRIPHLPRQAPRGWGRALLGPYLELSTFLPPLLGPTSQSLHLLFSAWPLGKMRTSFCSGGNQSSGRDGGLQMGPPDTAEAHERSWGLLSAPGARTPGLWTGRPSLPYSAHKHTCMCTNINAHLHLHTHTHVHPHRSHLCIHICNAHQVCTLVWRAQRHTSPHEQVSAGTCRPTTCALTRTPLGAPAPTHAHVSGGRSHSVHMNFEAERTQRRLMLWKRMDSDTHIRPTQPC